MLQTTISPVGSRKRKKIEKIEKHAYDLKTLRCYTTLWSHILIRLFNLNCCIPYVKQMQIIHTVKKKAKGNRVLFTKYVQRFNWCKRIVAGRKRERERESACQEGGGAAGLTEAVKLQLKVSQFWFFPPSHVRQIWCFLTGANSTTLHQDTFFFYFDLNHKDMRYNIKSRGIQPNMRLAFECLNQN